MRVTRRNPVTAALVVWLAPLVAGISVPTGKLTPITSAKPTPPHVNPRAPAVAAPVVEYTQEHPEPPPMNPSYVPPTFNYFDTLARHHIYYVPVRYRNFNNYNSPNSIDYEPPQKYLGHSLGKNVVYKRYKQPWAGQYQQQYNVQTTPGQPQQQQDNNQYTQHNVQPTPQPQQDNWYTRYSVQPTQQQQDSSQYTQQNVQPTQQQQDSSQYTQHNVQPMTVQQQQQQRQLYEVLSTQSAPSTVVTGKGSYDVTGKGGSKSDTEYYSKDDWSKKAYPKKAPATPKKYAGHKF